MQIRVKCFATLSRHEPDDPEQYEVPESATVADVIDSLGVPQDEVRIIFVNGKSAEPETTLCAGDKVGLFPAVGGG